jgi:hypothetical protein
MIIPRFLFLLLFTLFLHSTVSAQEAEQLSEIDAQYKACTKLKSDSVNCYRDYLAQSEALLSTVFEKIKNTLTAEEKAKFIKDHLSWVIKKEAHFKKQDENFYYHLKDGTWNKEMIRFPLQSKADFVKKRTQALIKQYKL